MATICRDNLVGFRADYMYYLKFYGLGKTINLLEIMVHSPWAMNYKVCKIWPILNRLGLFLSKSFMLCTIVLAMSSITLGWSKTNIRKTLKQGNVYYRKGQLDKALASYSKVLDISPDSSNARFNLGVTLYKKGKFKKAAKHFNRVAISSAERLEARSMYNVGNTNYKIATQEIATGNLESAVKSMRQSLDYYRRTMQLDKQDKDAKYNYELVQKKLKLLLDKLKQQQQQQKNQQQQEQKQQQQEQRNQQTSKQQKPSGSGVGKGEKKQQPQGQKKPSQQKTQQGGAKEGQKQQEQKQQQQEQRNQQTSKRPSQKMQPKQEPEKGPKKESKAAEAKKSEQRAEEEDIQPEGLSRRQASQLLDNVEHGRLGGAFPMEHSDSTRRRSRGVQYEPYKDW